MTLSRTHVRIKLIVILGILIPLGFYTKIYAGPGSMWVHNSLGGVFYVMFWCFVVALFHPRFPAWRNASLVTGITCLLEFTQLWKAGWLEYLRGYYLGRILLGHSFQWLDFPYYLIGGAAGFLLLKTIMKPVKVRTELD